jgi:hypothetical protein
MNPGFVFVVPESHFNPYSGNAHEQTQAIRSIYQLAHPYKFNVTLSHTNMHTWAELYFSTTAENMKSGSLLVILASEPGWA